MLKKLHKIIGLSISVIVIHLAVTGIILMFPYSFKLQDTYFTNGFIFSIYDMHKISEVNILENSEGIGTVASKVIISDLVLDTHIEPIISIAKQDNFTYVLGTNKLAVINEREYDLEIINQITLVFKPASIGKDNNNVVIKDVNGLFYFINKDLIFSKSESKNYTESRIVKPNYELSEYFLNQVQGPGIQALRVVTDLHNGRFFGPLVVIIFFISSFLIIFLAISGTYDALRPSVKRHLYKRKKKKQL